MNRKLGLAIREVHRGEVELAEELRQVGERHRVDHDVFHITLRMATWCEAHLERLKPQGERYGISLDPGDADDDGGLFSALREKGSELLGRRPESGLLLLRDVRKLHLIAANVSINWTILGQGAQAVRDQPLLDAVSACHPDTLRQLRWTTSKLKESAPQVLAS